MFVDTIQTVVSNVTDDYCRATITYALNDVVYDYEIIDDLTAGKHIISLNYPITGLTAGDTNTWKIFLECDGGTVTLPEQTMKATIWGQGLRDLDAWYGILEAEDTIPQYMVGLVLPDYVENVDFDYDREVKPKPVITQTIGTFSLGKSIVSLTDTIEAIDIDYLPCNIVDESGTYNIVDEDDTVNIKTEGRYL